MTQHRRRNLFAPLVLLLADVATAVAGTSVAGVEAWLDRPQPTDAPAGTELAIGLMLWHPTSDTPITPSLFVRLHPATGDGPPIEVTAQSDWPGHYIARLAVPDGGAGDLEVGTAGNACTASGCTRSDALYELAGVGPPPGAPLTTIAAATVVLPAERLIAGVPADVLIRLVPRAAWAPEDVPYPVDLVLQARRPREAVLVEATAGLVDRTAGIYQATITMPEDGPFVVEVATGEDNARAGRFGGSAVLLAVDPAPPPVGGDGWDPALVAAGLAAGAVLLAVVALALARRADR